MWSARIFRALLWSLPAPFRHEYGAEMEFAFLEQLQEAGPRPSAQAAVWLRSTLGLMAAAPQEHYHVIRNDVRYAVRSFAAQPAFTAIAVLSLALGIGANLALFSLVHAIQLRTLPVHDPGQLVMLTDPTAFGSSNGMQSGERSLLSYEEFLHLRDNTKVFAAIMASQSGRDQLQVRVNGQEPEIVRSRMVSAEYFSTLGVPALLGRTLSVQDGPKPHLAVISHEFWQRRFGGAPDAIGARVTLRNGVFTVIGVMPPEFFGETVGSRPDLWLPLDLQPVILPGRDRLHDSRAELLKGMWLHVFARLRPGVTHEQAQAAVSVAFQQNLQDFYSSAPNEKMRRNFLDQRLRLRPASTGASDIRGRFAEPLTILLGLASLVLLIACANLGNLMLARATARSREFALRLALGAGRGSLVRQILTESMLLALAGGIVGVAAAALLRAGLTALVPGNIQIPGSAFAPGVALFGFGLTIAVGLLLGLLPIIRTLCVDPGAGIKEQGRGLTVSAAWLRAGKLVAVGQLALSLPLLLCAGLLIRTLANLQHADLGFPKENLVLVRADVQRAGYVEAKRQALFDRLYARVQAIPGIRSASYSKYGMLIGGDSGDEVLVEGYTRQQESDTGSAYEHVGPGFFAAVGIPILAGREINDRDRDPGPKVCVINEAFAKRFFAGRNPIGLHVTQLYAHQRNTFEVVGIVANSRKDGLRGDIEHRYYVPMAHPIDVPHSITFAVRASGPVAPVIQAVRGAILAEDPEIPITAAFSIQDLVDERTAQDRLLARLAAVFGGAALFLTAIGIYGVLAYGVARRTSEIGIRKALGAREGTVISMILGETGWLLVAGLALGAGLAAFAVRWIESRLFGLASYDPASLGFAVVLLAAVALVAAWVPARRAAHIDPLLAIRYE